MDSEKIRQTIRQIRLELDSIEAELIGGAPPPAPATDNVVPPIVDGEIVVEAEGSEEIVGGVATSRFPDCCAVGDETRFYCTGTLIAPTLVVTAKHCKNIARAFFGRDIARPAEGETVRVIKDIPHEDPNVDLRLLVLEKAPKNVKPRHVAQGNEVGNPKTAVVAGFGTTDLAGTTGFGRKRRAKVPIISLSCSSASDQSTFGCRARYEMVAGHLGLMRDTCRGDSGGPLYIVNDDGEFSLLGATSRGTDSAQHVCGDGGIYVRVDAFLDWIRTKTGTDL
jgi:secreted trypsin-like serine protease